MADNIISQYYTKNDGTQISNDYQFSTLQDNEKIIQKNSGEKFVKNPSYSNVFDKTDTFGELESKINNKALASISNANDNGVASYYNVAGTKLGEFKCGLPVLGAEGNTNVTAVSQNGNILTVEVPRVYYDKYGRVTKWDKQTASAVVSGGSSSGVGYTGVPVGTISMWVGSVGDIPAGWHLCDGTNGTPDLRDRFVVGAGNKYNPGSTGYPSGSTSLLLPGSSSGASGETTRINAVHKPSDLQNGSFHRCSVDEIVSASELYSSYTNNFRSSYTLHNARVSGSWKCISSSLISTTYRSSDGVTWAEINKFDKGTFEKVEDGSNDSGDSIINISVVTDVEYYALCYIMKTQTDGSPTVVTNNNPELLWGQTLTVGAIDNKPLTVKMPANPNTDTKYSAGTGLSLRGTTFSISQELLDKINSGGSTENWSKFYFEENAGINVGDVVSGSKLYNDSDLASCVGSGSWRLMWTNVNKNWVSAGPTKKYYYGKFQKVG